MKRIRIHIITHLCAALCLVSTYGDGTASSAIKDTSISTQPHYHADGMSLTNSLQVPQRKTRVGIRLAQSAASDRSVPENKIIGPGGKVDSSVRNNIVVAIEYKDRRNVGRICTGVAIANKAILTAGHCTCGRKTSYQVWVGPNLRSNTATQIAVESVQPIPGYDCSEKHDNRGLDIGLIKLKSSHPNIQDSYYDIAYMGDVIAKAPEQLEVFGYGINDSGTVDGLRRSIDIAVSTLKCAKQRWVDDGCIPLQEFILAARLRGLQQSPADLADSCDGDSGGPVFWKVSEEEKYLVGVVSRAAQNRQSIFQNVYCGGGGIYSTVGQSSVITWLRQTGIELQLFGEE